MVVVPKNNMEAYVNKQTNCIVSHFTFTPIADKSDAFKFFVETKKESTADFVHM